MKQVKIKVESPNVKYTEELIESNYVYQTTRVQQTETGFSVKPVETSMQIQTSVNVPTTGLMLVGWGGNNGSTFTAALVANRWSIKWSTKTGEKVPNWYGSLTQCSTVNLGLGENNEPVHVPMASLLPTVDPSELAVDGWDISSMNLADALQRSEVIDYDLQKQLRGYMQSMVPRRAPYYPEFIAANQRERADNVLRGSKWDHLLQIRADIRHFKSSIKLQQVVVLWTANTERQVEEIAGVNDSHSALLDAIKSNDKNISPSTIFAVAAILEGCTFINGSPQNTLVKGCIELAEIHGVFLAGDDFKSGQTKTKTVLVDFLVSAGIKPISIASYNHLGNNDGFNLTSPQQFRSKEISKSNVIDDILRSNSILYKPDESIDHCVVIKYMAAVGDSKRAMDEYTSELMMGGRNTIVIHNTCEDSLLAAPIILDLVILAELATRIKFKTPLDSQFSSFTTILSMLGYLLKAPLVPEGTPVVNSLFKQRACIENILKACLGLPPDNNMLLEFKLKQPIL